MVDIESNNKEMQLPQKLFELKDEKEFLDNYKDLTDRYWNNFNDFELQIIKETWKKWCAEFTWKLNKTSYRIIENRIDKWIFEYRYPQFTNIDKNIIRKIANADTQRKFREVAIKLTKKFSIITKQEIELIESKFLRAKNDKTTPNFDEISNEIIKIRNLLSPNAWRRKLEDELDAQQNVEMESHVGQISTELQKLWESINKINTTHSNNNKDNEAFHVEEHEILHKSNDPKKQVYEQNKNTDNKFVKEPVFNNFDKQNINKRIQKIDNDQVWLLDVEDFQNNIPQKFAEEVDLGKDINPFFANVWQEYINSDTYKSNWNEQKVKNEYIKLAKNLSDIIKPEDLEHIDPEWKDDIARILKNHLQLVNKWEKNSTSAVENSIYDIAENQGIMGIFWKRLDKEANKLKNIDEYINLNDSEDVEMYELNQVNNDKQEQEELLKRHWIDIDNYKKMYKIYAELKSIKEKLDKWKQLNEKEEKFLAWIQEQTWEDPRDFLNTLKSIFGNDWKKILQSIKEYEMKYGQQDRTKTFNKWHPEWYHTEKIEWNINSINPDSIVQYNNEIHDYVFKSNKESLYDTDDEKISPEYQKALYQQLISQHSSDKTFLQSTEYLDEYWEIDYKKIKDEKIDEESIKKNYKVVKKMIDDLADKEFHNKKRIKRINSISTRKCIMSTCFRALSKYFDSSNNNGENFANEFEIKDINENIWFDKDTWIIKMTWTIWWNNHIWLYYDTKKWELSFDNFIWYNSNVWYIIWKNSGEVEKLNIKLPTMQEMEEQCKKVDKNLIYNMSLTTPQYIHNLSKWLKESLRIWCFQWFIWTSMDVNRQFVKQFNEKNILKQDILKSIYTQYYDENSVNKILNDKLIISEWETKEQYKLVKLISDSINNCKDADELLRFRNLINKFDNILETNKKLIKEDKLLSTLFIDDENDAHDIYDESNQTIQQENHNIWAQKKEKKSKHTTLKHEKNKKTKPLNYFIFLDLLSDNWHIDLDVFDIALNTIEKEWTQLLDKKTWIMRNNYCKKVEKWELAEIVNIEWEDQSSLANLEKQMENAYDDLKI